MQSVIEMIDQVSEERRSYIMSQVGSKDTGPEMIVRQLLHRLGYRFRLHCHELPGSPDIVFRLKRKVVFVHGCFWHGHSCKHGNLPKSKVSYWGPKIAANRQRDVRNMGEMRDAGWDTLIIWQCELADREVLQDRLVSFLGPAKTVKRGSP